MIHKRDYLSAQASAVPTPLRVLVYCCVLALPMAATGCSGVGNKTYAYTVSVVSGKGGRADTSQVAVLAGHAYTVGAYPNKGYKVASVVGCGASRTDDRLLHAYRIAHVTRNCTVRVNFLRKATDAQPQSPPRALNTSAPTSAKYSVLRELAGNWTVHLKGKSSPISVSSTCKKLGKFFLCQVLLDGKNVRLQVFTPNSQGLYHVQTINPDGSSHKATASFAVTGDQLVYSSLRSSQGVYYRIVSAPYGSNDLRITVSSSSDGNSWNVVASGVAERSVAMSTGTAAPDQTVDPYGPLRKAIGTWSIKYNGGSTSADLSQVCKKIGIFFACRQSLSNSAGAYLAYLFVYTPPSPDQPNKYNYQSLKPDGSAHKSPSTETVSSYGWVDLVRPDSKGMWTKVVVEVTGKNSQRLKISKSREKVHWHVVLTGVAQRIQSALGKPVRTALVEHPAHNLPKRVKNSAPVKRDSLAAAKEPVTTESTPAITYTSLSPSSDFPSVQNYYPQSSMRLGKQGTTIVKVCVGRDGELSAPPSVITSSGSQRLDQAALRYARATSGHWNPERANGRPINFCGHMPIRFQLTDF